jgi:hypothetical protein
MPQDKAKFLLNDWMSQCLQMASWREVGKFTSGPQRDQARVIKEAEITFQGDGAHERDCF